MGPEDGKAVQLANGDILAPAADRNGFFDGGNLYVEISTDKGETWTPSETNEDDNGFTTIQPNILIHADGRLQMMARGRGGKIPVTWSNDNGRTWSGLEASTLPANWSGLDVISTRDGRHFIAYNHDPTPEGEKGERCFLTLAVSPDGVNWSAAQVLGICDGGQLSYPAIIQGRDGLLHVVHTYHRDTIAHIVINPYLITDATIEPMPTGEWPTSGPLSAGENQDKEG
jgi:predicted neuraminidase